MGGCPNNCVNPNLNDLGIIGASIPEYDVQKCRTCKKCKIEAACPIGAAKLSDGKISVDKSICNDCGRCIGKCPFHCADSGSRGWKVYIGGRWGKRTAQGKMLSKTITDKNELMDIIEKSLLLFRSEGISGERFADTINRIGFEKTQEMLLVDELLSRREKILSKNL